MTAIALTPTERAWAARVQSAIGSRRQLAYKHLLDEPVGMAPRIHILQQLLAHDGRGRAHAKQMMAIALLNHSSFERQDGVDGEELMDCALNIPMLDVIASLHAKGFVFSPRSHHRSLIITHLCAGRWPHPDLLTPDLLDHHLTVNSGALAVGLFSNLASLREEFLRKLVRLPTNEDSDWFGKINDGYLNACSGEKIQAIIHSGKMHRSQVVSSLAVLHARGWLTQDGLEQSVRGNAYLEADWLMWARELLHEAAGHELQQSTPRADSRPRARRI